MKVKEREGKTKQELIRQIRILSLIFDCIIVLNACISSYSSKPTGLLSIRVSVSGEFVSSLNTTLFISHHSCEVLFESVCISTGMLSIIIAVLVNFLIETSGKNMKRCISFISHSGLLFMCVLYLFRFHSVVFQFFLVP